MSNVKEIQQLNYYPFYQVCNKAVLLLSSLNEENLEAVDLMYDYIVNNFAKNILENDLDDQVLREKTLLFINLAIMHHAFSMTQKNMICITLLKIQQNLFAKTSEYYEEKNLIDVDDYVESVVDNQFSINSYMQQKDNFEADSDTGN